MNLAAIPLLLVALLMISADPEVETVRLVMSGNHQIEVEDGVVIVGEGAVTIPAGAETRGPVYVIGGELTVSGTITSDLVQLAGTVTIAPDAGIGDELRYVAGTLNVSDRAEVGRRTSIDLTGTAPDPLRGLIPTIALTVLLAGVGYLLADKRNTNLANVASAGIDHPVVALSVGFLLALTFIALFVFMALTLLLLPVALVGGAAVFVTLGYGIIGWGHALGARLPIGGHGISTVVGVILLVAGLQVLGRIPFVGDVVVAGLVLSGLGAVVLTYFGATRFRPAQLSD